jgi:2-deoxy-D-gluconate 3-dehydrogenase
MNDMFDLSGMSAVVTGASTGLGGGMSVALAAAGADILLVDHKRRETTAEEIRAEGRKAVSIAVDLATDGSVDEIVRVALDAFGKIDILINNAGMIRRKPAIDVSREEWTEVIAVNATSAFFLAQAAARDMMKRKHGKIVNIASLLSFQGGIMVPAYAASKGAVAQMTKAMANEWAPHGINVNAIAPGYMATDNTKALREDPVRSRSILDRIPAGRWGTPEDVKGAVLFLAGRASDYVHGHTLVVDGGWLAR